jgi:hypothetical protein
VLYHLRSPKEVRRDNMCRDAGLSERAPERNPVEDTRCERFVEGRKGRGGNGLHQSPV